MKRIVINTLDDLDIAFQVTRKLFDVKGICDVVVKDHSASITEAQRGLYWTWISVIAKDQGYSKIELHERYKERVFLNIYIEDQDNHPLFNDETVQSMKIIKEKAPEQYPTLRALVLNGVSHLDATKENMMEVLKAVESDAIRMQVRLPVAPREGLY